MNDLTADPDSIANHGAVVCELGEDVSERVDSGDLALSVDGLVAPQYFELMVDKLKTVCKDAADGLSGDGTSVTSCGNAHDANEDAQERSYGGGGGSATAY